MRNKWFKLMLPIGGIGIVSASTISIMSCAQSGLSPHVISQIMQVYQTEAVSANLDENIINVGTIGVFTPHTPNDTDVNYWNCVDKNDKKYKDAVADANAWSDQITAPMKTWIYSNIQNGKNLIGASDDQNITNIPGYKTFREQYFTVHLANIKAQSISNLDEPIWVFNDADNFKLFQCLQNSNDNVEWKKDQNYAGSNYLTFGGQIPDYLNDNTNKAFYQILNLPYLWSTELFNKDTKTPLYRPFAKDTETIVTISYLITFSPKPWTNEAPPIAFYVYANLRCGGIT